MNINHSDVTEVNDRVLPDFIIYAGATNLKKTIEYKKLKCLFVKFKMIILEQVKGFTVFNYYYFLNYNAYFCTK